MSVIDVYGDFEKEVLKEKKTVLVDFNAEWCGPCNALAPTIEELSDEMEDVKFVSVNIDENREVASEYEVSSIPCLVIFKDGKEVDRMIGLCSKKKVVKFLEKNQ